NRCRHSSAQAGPSTWARSATPTRRSSRWSASSPPLAERTTVSSNPNLRRLHEAGVSIWLDTISRQLLASGDFAALIRDFSVTGATSNPTIFAKAITGSDLYDEQLRGLASGGHLETQELFFTLALDDVRAAARELRPAYDRSGGRDGFMSFECTPDLADDTEATIAQACDLWQRLDEPNVMIKVPGTRA